MELKNEIKIEKLKNLAFQKLLTKLFIFIIGLSLVLFGIISNKILILAGIGIIFTPFIIKGVNSLYSVLMVLYLLHSTYFTLELGFEWTSLYYLVAILIVAYIIIKKIVDFKK